jgi:hypothetical protein
LRIRILEGDFLDPLSLHPDLDGVMIAAQRIVPFHREIGIVDFPEIPGILIMIENNLLV